MANGHERRLVKIPTVEDARIEMRDSDAQDGLRAWDSEIKDKEHTVKLAAAEKSARRDALTGLGNRAAFDHTLEQDFQRLRRKIIGSVALVMIDVDHFKLINDTRGGHPAGDAVLIDLAKLIQGSVRSVDTLFRYGGEEFVLILEGNDESTATDAAEKLRGLVSGHHFSYDGKDIPVTASFGIAVVTNADEITPEALIKRADDAMYTAKVDRNKVVLFPSI